MKKLFAPGAVAIISYASRLPTVDGLQHDPWPSHAGNGQGFSIFQTTSGNNYFVYDFTLKSFDHFFYVYEPTGPTLSELQVYQGWLFSLPFPLNWEGEHFNFITRPQLIFKGTDVQLQEWLAAN